MFEGKWPSKDSAVGTITFSAQLGLTINPYFGDLAPIALVLLACFNSEAFQFLTNDPSHYWCSTRVCSHCSHTLNLAKFYCVFTVQHATLTWMLCAEICQVLDLVWIPDSSTRPARHLLAGFLVSRLRQTHAGCNERAVAKVSKQAKLL